MKEHDIHSPMNAHSTRRNAQRIVGFVLIAGLSLAGTNCAHLKKRAQKRGETDKGLRQTEDDSKGAYIPDLGLTYIQNENFRFVHSDGDARLLREEFKKVVATPPNNETALPMPPIPPEDLITLLIRNARVYRRLKDLYGLVDIDNDGTPIIWCRPELDERDAEVFATDVDVLLAISKRLEATDISPDGELLTESGRVELRAEFGDLVQQATSAAEGKEYTGKDPRDMAPANAAPQESSPVGEWLDRAFGAETERSDPELTGTQVQRRFDLHRATLRAFVQSKAQVKGTTEEEGFAKPGTVRDMGTGSDAMFPFQSKIGSYDPLKSECKIRVGDAINLRMSYADFVNKGGGASFGAGLSTQLGLGVDANYNEETAGEYVVDVSVDLRESRSVPEGDVDEGQIYEVYRGNMCIRIYRLFEHAWDRRVGSDASAGRLNARFNVGSEIRESGRVFFERKFTGAVVGVSVKGPSAGEAE